MQAKTLKQPGHFSNAERIRRDVAHAISRVECAKASGAPGEGALLSAFLLDAGAKTPDAVAPTLPATQAIVSNAGTVNVENSAGNLDSTGTLTVAANAVTNVRLAATKTILTNADVVPVKHFDNTVVASSGVTAEVANGVIVSAKLPATRALTTNGTKIPVGTVSGSGTFGTFTVANGVITGIVLSAS